MAQLRDFVLEEGLKSQTLAMLRVEVPLSSLHSVAVLSNLVLQLDWVQ